MIVSSGTTSPEDGFDCDQNTFKITGGIVLGIGGGTSTPTSSVCTQRTVIYGGSGSNGEILNIQSADGTSILTYQIPRAYSQMTVLFSSPNLTSGGSYTISKEERFPVVPSSSGYIREALIPVAHRRQHLLPLRW